MACSKTNPPTKLEFLNSSCLTTDMPFEAGHFTLLKLPKNFQHVPWFLHSTFLWPTFGAVFGSAFLGFASAYAWGEQAFPAERPCWTVPTEWFQCKWCWGSRDPRFVVKSGIHSSFLLLKRFHVTKAVKYSSNFTSNFSTLRKKTYNQIWRCFLKPPSTGPPQQHKKKHGIQTYGHGIFKYTVLYQFF